MKKVIIVLGSLAGIGFLMLVVFLAAHNIPTFGNEKVVEKTIVVDKIYEGGVKDIVFAQNDGEFYYINRGLEQGYTLEGLRKQLLNKTVTLQVSNKLAGPSAHINILRLGDEVIYDENELYALSRKRTLNN